MSVREWLDYGRSIASLRACDRVGPGARLRGSPVIWNAGRLTIGSGFRLSSLPVVSHLFTGSEGLLEIGDDVVISFGAAIACVSRVRIGAATRIGPLLALADSDFHVVGDRNAVPEPRPVEIGRGVRIGARVTVLPGCSIGDRATVLAGSTVAGAVPTGAVVFGVPARLCRVSEPSQVSAMAPS